MVLLSYIEEGGGNELASSFINELCLASRKTFVKEVDKHSD